MDANAQDTHLGVHKKSKQTLLINPFNFDKYFLTNWSEK